MITLPTNKDIYLFHQGTNYFSYQSLGCHYHELNGRKGYLFSVWAPNAVSVTVAGDFNHWTGSGYKLERIPDTGIWKGFFTTLAEGIPYKYKIITKDGHELLKADPFAFQMELRPLTASLTPSTSSYKWNDQNWQKSKEKQSSYQSAVSIYEIHFGSWKLKKDGTYYSYREMAEMLIPYVKKMGFTHIELMPIAEHPYDLSWGYQITGYFAPTSRYGTADDLRFFIDQCHQANIGVILDWVPGHFCKDEQGLRLFDGSPIYEYCDPDKAEKHTWGTLTFDFGRPEVQSFLISNALYWLKEFHLDGLRVDAVASMTCLNFDRPEHLNKVTNSYGTEVNLEALAFLKKLNEVIFHYFPHTFMMAEDSSDMALVTSPVSTGGLGFNYKWNMGWMNDLLEYMSYDPVYRKWHHHLVSFSMMYHYSENFVLPLSHDEVVHGKKSLLDKMPGDQWQQFANLRVLYGYMFCHPGKKLLFMGGEFGQYMEWRDHHELDWLLLDYPLHNQMQKYLQSLLHFYRKNLPLYQLDYDQSGFEWIDADNCDHSIYVFQRISKQPDQFLVIICHFTPNVYENYKVGVPLPGTYKEIFNSDDSKYGGSGQINTGNQVTINEEWHCHKQHIRVKIPPLAISIYQLVKEFVKEETK
ncbi:1,4-alpha-glucan branching enzyme [Gracilibacillus ureilyticus]|uniref:1,4-alpha-glucan branching enzyme GlgB n=1 Tax=Gracilibacillus ureilyticus TaxID=531814 RepID=A0A1H9LJX5_9BACI|nr:1,4-alpha-glucan branching protein GlgB [Gracilibacillus ureilyticus]SER11415.1 1,4-alpha-glucan branching enzyme [Gracilibacillus ureilyticus]